MTVKNILQYIRARDNATYAQMAAESDIKYKNLMAHITRSDAMGMSVSQLLDICTRYGLTITLEDWKGNRSLPLDGEDDIDDGGYLYGLFVGSDKNKEGV